MVLNARAFFEMILKVNMPVCGVAVLGSSGAGPATDYQPHPGTGSLIQASTRCGRMPKGRYARHIRDLERDDGSCKGRGYIQKGAGYSPYRDRFFLNHPRVLTMPSLRVNLGFQSGECPSTSNDTGLPSTNSPAS